MKFNPSIEMKTIALGILLLLLAAVVDAQLPTLADAIVACAAIHPQARIIIAVCIIFRIIESLAAIIAAIALAFAGLKWAMSEDLPEREDAKKMATGAIIGVLIVIISLQLIIALFLVEPGEVISPYDIVSFACPLTGRDTFSETLGETFCIIFYAIQIIAAVVAGVVLAFAGIEWMTFERPWLASDEPDLRAKAKGRATHALIGLLVVIITGSLITEIVPAAIIPNLDCTPSKLSKPIAEALCFILASMIGFAAVIAAIILAYCGVEWIVSESSDVRADAKGRALYAITGLIVTVIIILLMNAIISEIGYKAIEPGDVNVGIDTLYVCNPVRAMTTVSRPIAEALCVILRVIQALATVIAGIVLAYSGIEWLTSESPDQIASAKSRAVKAILGLIVVILSLNLVVWMMNAGGFFAFNCENVFDYANCVREKCGLETALIGPPGGGTLQASITSPADGSTHWVGFPVKFEDPPTGGTMPYYWLWEFGDGTPDGPEQNPTHTYEETGDFSVKLTVTDSSTPPQEDEHSITLHLILPPDNNPPEAVIWVDTHPGTMRPGDITVNIDNVLYFESGSTDPDLGDYVEKYKWEWVEEARVLDETDGFGKDASYFGLGVHTIKLTVWDRRDAEDDVEVKVTVEEEVNNPPVAVIKVGTSDPPTGTGDITVNTGDTIYFDGSDSSDPDPGDKVIAWDWTWVKDPIEVLSNEVSFNKPAADFDIGEHTIQLTVIDESHGAPGDAQIKVTVEAAMARTVATCNARGFMDGTTRLFSECTGDAGCQEDWTCVTPVPPGSKRIDHATMNSFCMTDELPEPKHCCWDWENEAGFDCPPPTPFEGNTTCYRPIFDNPVNSKECWCVFPGNDPRGDAACEV